MVDKENNKNMNFPDVRNNEKDDYEEFDGEEITLTLINKNNSSEVIKEKFKGGQDFEYVKYVLGKKLDTNKSIELYNSGKKVIPLFSICDIQLTDNSLEFEVLEN